MTINSDNPQGLEQELDRLESKLADLQARLPAHSISPQLIAEMDEIDEQINDVKSRLTGFRATETIENQSND